jgi:TonB-linked SusC/RagA family outer membrane protein
MKPQLLAVIMLLFALPAWAQTGSVTGIVTDSQTGEILPGVNVVLVELEQGASSDANGRYNLENVPAGTHTLRASFIGFETLEATVNVVAGQVLTRNIRMTPDVIGLSELIVTALGVEREERSLGYASQAVNTEGMDEARSTNFVNSLQGRVAGAQITNANSSVGGSSRIVLRGVNSLTGDNQPLFIVDGVYIDNSTFDAGAEFGPGPDFGNAAMDINPDDIASITVLKGPNAAALYGSRAANGAIIITTKDGRASRRGQVDVTFNSTLMATDILLLPDMQNDYGQGQFGTFDYVDGRGGGIYDGGDESWGPPLDGRLIRQFDSPIVNGERQPTPWVPAPNNVRDYFNTGLAWTNNISVSGAFDRTNYRLSYTNLREDGLFPAEKLGRHSFQIGAGADLSSRLRTEVRATYTLMEAENRPSVGYNGDNPMQQLTQWFGRQINIESLRDYKMDDGTQFNWNHQYFDNPFWIQYENGNAHNRNRLIGNITTTFELADWVSLVGLVGTDRYQDRRRDWTAINTLNQPQGAYSETYRDVAETTANLRLSGERDLSPDFYLSATVGGESRYRDYSMRHASTAALSVPFVYSINNSALSPTASDRVEEKQVNSLFAATTLGYRDLLYLDLTGRNDWSSTLPKGNNSYFYPSASLAFILSEAVDVGDWMNFGKLRASWTRVGNDTDPYRLRAVYSAPGTGRFGDVPYYTVSDQLPNADLRPERTESWEFGGEFRVANNRLGLDLTYYSRRTFDQILPVQISPASGYVSQIVNAGEVANSGVEISLSATPVRTADFSWDARINWAANRNEVVELAGDLEAFILGSSWDTRVEARPGEAFGTIYGYGFLRDANGNIAVSRAGIPLIDRREFQSFGSYQPDWTAGINNTFTFRNISLSSLIDIKQGGVLTSTTYMFGRYTGILTETLEGRECNMDTGANCIVFDGDRWADGAVKARYNEAGQIMYDENGFPLTDGPNDIPVGAQRFNTASFFGNAESHIFDASYIKLRELRLGYRLPAQWLQQSPLRSVDLGLVGRNLLILHKNSPHIDPETAFNAGNVQGLESNQFPAARTFGFNIRASF